MLLLLHGNSSNRQTSSDLDARFGARQRHCPRRQPDPPESTTAARRKDAAAVLTYRHDRIK
ncbi:hypothetical protein XHC_4086 [Xanthomonas hortorum pv. carotae str. M081]|nr:hypothetical protein XHC_4086 [Xanthomonas hortorum pv. carotae str. M081]